MPPPLTAQAVLGSSVVYWGLVWCIGGRCGIGGQCGVLGVGVVY